MPDFDFDATDGTPEASDPDAGQGAAAGDGALRPSRRRCPHRAVTRPGRLRGGAPAARHAMRALCPRLEGEVMLRLGGRVRGGWDRCLRTTPRSYEP